MKKNGLKLLIFLSFIFLLLTACSNDSKKNEDKSAKANDEVKSGGIVRIAIEYRD